MHISLLAMSHEAAVSLDRQNEILNRVPPSQRVV